jgi:hypothetical protein
VCRSATVSSCGTEFGYHDGNSSISSIRAEWLRSGAKWWSTVDVPPPGRDPYVEISNALTVTSLQRFSGQDYLDSKRRLRRVFCRPTGIPDSRSGTGQVRGSVGPPVHHQWHLRECDGQVSIRREGPHARDADRYLLSRRACPARVRQAAVGSKRSLGFRPRPPTSNLPYSPRSRINWG